MSTKAKSRAIKKQKENRLANLKSQAAQAQRMLDKCQEGKHNGTVFKERLEKIQAEISQLKGNA